MFVIASAVTVLSSLLYGLGVGAYRNDSFFFWMLIGAAGLLCAWAGASDAASGLSASVLFCFYFVTQAIFLNHYWTFAGDYFDTLTTKRLFPLFAAGNSAGGVLGGGIAVVVSLVASAEALIYVWAFFLALGAGLLRLERRRLRRWGPLELEEADETSVSGLRDGAALHPPLAARTVAGGLHPRDDALSVRGAVPLPRRDRARIPGSRAARGVSRSVPGAQQSGRDRARGRALAASDSAPRCGASEPGASLAHAGFVRCAGPRPAAAHSPGGTREPRAPELRAGRAGAQPPSTTPCRFGFAGGSVPFWKGSRRTRG